ncbi:unnamed protein product [Ambrosiozyma monospora]|uniref:Unnamed protein product n=1 Tax=Ambrosiozyma monospora TaxID=43982 RepID=A0ACB5TC41_AMBMO|nr:unnamed protein product [Ambrosiozyma monospora]
MLTKKLRLYLLCFTFQLEKSFLKDEEELQHLSHSFTEVESSHGTPDVSIALTKEILQLLYDTPPVLSPDTVSTSNVSQDPQIPQNVQIPQTPLTPPTVSPGEPSFNDTTPMSTGSLLDGYLDEFTNDFVTANFDHDSSEDELSLLSSSNGVCTAVPNDPPIPVISAPSNVNTSTHEHKSSSQILSRCSSPPLTSVANSHAEQEKVSTNPSSNVPSESSNSGEDHPESLEDSADESDLNDGSLDPVESTNTTHPKPSVSNVTEIQKGDVKPAVYEIGVSKSFKDTGEMTSRYLLNKVNVAAYLDQCYGYYDESIDDIEFDSLNDMFSTAGFFELSKLGEKDVRKLRCMISSDPCDDAVYLNLAERHDEISTMISKSTSPVITVEWFRLVVDLVTCFSSDHEFDSDAFFQFVSVIFEITSSTSNKYIYCVGVDCLYTLFVSMEVSELSQYFMSLFDEKNLQDGLDLKLELLKLVLASNYQALLDNNQMFNMFSALVDPILVNLAKKSNIDVGKLDELRKVWISITRVLETENHEMCKSPVVHVPDGLRRKISLRSRSPLAVKESGNEVSTDGLSAAMR